MSTNSQPAVGIAGVQAAARSSGSTTRAGSKKFFLLAIRWAPLIGFMLALAFLWKDYASKTPQEKGDAPTATTSAQAAKQEAKWERQADGTIPIGVWSGTITIEPGCGVRFGAGEGTYFKVQYRFGSSVEWSDHIPGTIPDGNQVRYQVTKTGLVELPIKSTCS